MDLPAKPVKMIISGDDYIARKVLGSLAIGLPLMFVWFPTLLTLPWKLVGTAAVATSIGFYLRFLRDLKPGAEWLDLQNHNQVIHLFRLHRTISLDSIDHVWLEVNDRDPDS